MMDSRNREKVVRVLCVPCEVYSRVTGYYRPVQNWNPGKQQEFLDRRHLGVMEVRRAVERR